MTNIRENLDEKTDEELAKIAEANGIKVEDATREQLIEILILAAENDLPEEGRVDAR